MKPHILPGAVVLFSLLQHHSLKTSILRHLAFFVIQLAHQYVTTGA